MKILLVDDEKYTREGILQDIDWDLLGIDTVYQGTNGLEALKIAEDYPIDILLTDVKMPKMNGIELAYKIQALYPDVKILFMSGYSDKEYLKSAIELNAVRYIEKPLDIEELSAAIKKSIYLADTSKHLKNLIDTSMPLIHNNIALGLTKSKSETDEIKKLIKEQFPKYPQDSHYQVLMIKLISNERTIQELINYDAFNNLLQQLIPPAIWCYKDEHHILIHFAINQSELDFNQLKNTYMLRALINGLINEEILYSIIVGPIVDTLDALPISYRQTVIASKILFLNPNKEIVLAKRQQIANYYEFKEIRFKKFKEYINNSQFDQGEKLIRQLTEELKKQNTLLEAQIKSYYYHFLVILQTAFTHLSESYQVKDMTQIINSHNFFMMSSIDQIETYLINHLQMVAGQVDSPAHYSESCHTILQQIHQSYDNPDLSLTDLADLSHLSISHMCVLFKKETDMTINQYLTEYRIKRALHLLLQEDIKLQYVANQVGFNDPNYFTKLFKKTLGITPSQYRELKANE